MYIRLIAQNFGAILYLFILRKPDALIENWELGLKP